MSSFILKKSKIILRNLNYGTDYACVGA